VREAEMKMIAIGRTAEAGEQATKSKENKVNGQRKKR
jgi:hypothetical protein